MFRALANLQLRTKFLYSFVLVTAGLTCASLLVVRHAARVQMQNEVEEDAHNAILTFQVMEREHQIALSHKADLLATLAHIRSGDASVIEDSSEDPWQSDDCNLFALADRSGKIVALHTTASEFPLATAEAMLRQDLTERKTAGWWYSGTRLYQVALHRVRDADQPNGSRQATVVVGREMDVREANDLRRISSTHVAFRYGDDVLVSTLFPIQEHELAQQIQDSSDPQPIHIDGEWFWAESVELTPGTRPAVRLTVLKSYNGAMALLTKLNHVLLFLGLMAVLAGGVLVFVISDTLTRPLASLADGVRALERGDFAYPLEANGGDEVAHVTRAFDRMRRSLQSNQAKRQQLEDQLRQAQRMEAIGRLAGGVAHDFNNLLTVVKGHSDLVLERLKPGDPIYRNSEQIAKAADRAASLTRQLLAFSRMQVLQPKVLDLNALVADMEKLLARLIREDITFTFRPDDSLGRMKADPGQIEQVILNLTVNACDAMPRGGTLAIETHNVTLDEQTAQTRPPMPAGHYVLLTVADTGQGMDASTKARIFEPFFTTKELGKGTGLGLATVYGVVKQSGGFIWVDSEPGKGARFEVYFPRVDEQVEAVQLASIATKATGWRKTILIAEDESAVRELASEFLKSAGYLVLTAEDGAEALAVANKLHAPIHVLLTDVVMPNMRGPELAKQLKHFRPETKIVYMSGYLDYDKGDGEFLEEGFFLQKPFSHETLVNKVSEALANQPNQQPIAQLTPPL